jgi:hypothetical protein
MNKNKKTIGEIATALEAAQVLYKHGLVKAGPSTLGEFFGNSNQATYSDRMKAAKAISTLVNFVETFRDVEVTVS